MFFRYFVCKLFIQENGKVLCQIKWPTVATSWTEIKTKYWMDSLSKHSCTSKLSVTNLDKP